MTVAASQPNDETVARFGRLRSVVFPLVSLALLAIAAFIAHRVTADIRIADVQAAIRGIPLWRMGAAFGFTAVSFAALASFDVLAVSTAAPGAVSPGKAAAAGALGFAISNVLGFSAVTGGALRYRIYSAEGLDAAKILGVIVTSYLSFWLGFAALLGVTLVYDPADLSALKVLGPAAELAIGAAILIGLGAGVALAGPEGRAVRFRSASFRLPPRRVMLVQILAGSVDMAASAAVLYVLIPADIRPNIPYFLVVYAGGMLFGIASHAPGGLGVFEATMITALGPQHSAETIAALIVYRLIYYAVPFTVGVTSLAALESLRNRAHLSVAATDMARIVRPIIPVASGALVFLAGLVLLISGATPRSEPRLTALQDLLPLPLIETSHLLGSIIGVVLLIVARGLVRRFHTAWAATLGLLAAGAAASLVKGIDVEEALVMAAAAGLLVAFRSAFYRRTDLSSLRLSPRWLAMVIAAIVAVTWLGFFSYRHVAYANELWWQFEWSGDAPRFMRASVAVAAIVIWAAVHSLVTRPPGRPFVPDPVTEPIRRLVAASPQTQANVALVGDKKFLLAEDQSAFLMYGGSGRSLITMGDPIGAATAATDLIWRFREIADREGLRAIHYAVGAAYLPAYLDMGLQLLKIGEVAHVDVQGFSLDGKKRTDFRYAVRRAEREGMRFEVLSRPEVAAAMAELRGVSDAWLSQKAGHEKSFSLGAFSEAYMAQFDCAVMRDADGIVAFANLWRGGKREELSVDIMRYLPHRSPILMDALFANLLLYGKAEGYRWFNLGAAPLSGLSDHHLASSWNRVGSLLSRHGEYFYRFEGLKAFKQKFDPVWSPQYVAARGNFAMPGVLLDVTALISGGRLGVLAK